MLSLCHKSAKKLVNTLNVMYEACYIVASILHCNTPVLPIYRDNFLPKLKATHFIAPQAVYHNIGGETEIHRLKLTETLMQRI